jgi:hypothetical protein
MKKRLSLIGHFFTFYILLVGNLFGQNLGLSSGSGFAISPNGYLVTNHHVIEGAKLIAVQQYINGELIAFNAKIIKDDAKNDIAILKIDDPNFKGFGTLPYTIKTQTVEKGSEIFAMGYPRIDVLGEEVKVTKGYIVSLTGIQGDAGHYQIQAPIDHGNSGGPLFDSEGNVIGITDSGESGGITTVYYAIKASKLTTLTDLMPDQIRLPTQNSIKGLTFPQQVKALEKYVFLIKVISSLPPTNQAPSDISQAPSSIQINPNKMFFQKAWLGRKFILSNQYISYWDAKNKMEGNSEASKLLEEGSKSLTTAKILTFTAPIAILVGFGLSSSRESSYNINTGTYSKSILPEVLVLGGLASFITSFFYTSSANKKYFNAVYKYNSSRGLATTLPKSQFEVGYLGGDKLGLRLSF